jgi:hypothetical protein
MAAGADSRPPRRTVKTSAAASARGKQQVVVPNEAAAAAATAGAVSSERLPAVLAAHQDLKCRARREEQLATNNGAVPAAIRRAVVASCRPGDREIVPSRRRDYVIGVTYGLEDYSICIG